MMMEVGVSVFPKPERVMALFTADKIYVAAVAVLITSFIAWLGDVLTKPLRKMPGPWYSLWTDVVLKYHVLKGHKAIYVHQLHVQYGPVVRISPTQADISDLSAAQRIHQMGNEFVKSDWYKTMSVDKDNVFNTSDMALHRRYLRLLSSPMSESGLKAMRPTVDEMVKLMVDKVALEMKGRGRVADVMKWATFMSTDVISELTFGESFRLLEAGKKNSYIRDMEAAAPLLALRALFPLIRRIVFIAIPRRSRSRIGSNRIVGRSRPRRCGIRRFGLAVGVGHVSAYTWASWNCDSPRPVSSCDSRTPRSRGERGMCDDDMEQLTYFLAFPKGRRCLNTGIVRTHHICGS